ncbi:MAG: hypothetical protein DRP58_10540 [Spirochaetes bacterium]|nr:MAG: hypothetical protein DRP58_10540 [Spirochaetota bacterium]
MSKLSIIPLLFIFSLSFLNALEIRTEPEDYWLKTNSWGKTITPSMAIESSLAASGLVGEDLTLYKNKYEQIIIKFRNDQGTSFQTLSAYEQGEFILNWIHYNILKNYIEEQTLMDVLIDTGNYNCVSSAVFYLILSRETGLNAEIIETSDHAFCTVNTEKGWIDVETTTAYGFNPGVKQEFQQAFNQTGYTYVPSGNYRNRQNISDKETVALILQNRMSVLQKHNLHKQAVGLAIDRWTLANTEKNYKDMNNSFRNWSAVLNNKASYSEAFYFLNDVSQKYNLNDENKDLLYDLAYNQVIFLTNNGNYNLANIFLLKTETIIDDDDQNKLEELVIRDYLADIVKNESYNISLPLVRNAYKSGNISKSVWQNWITVLHQNEALLISKNEGWWNSWKFMESLPSEEKSLNSIKSSITHAHDNWSFEIHNRFADLFNNRDFFKAEQLLQQGLSLDPDNKYLKKDLSDLKKIYP